MHYLFIWFAAIFCICHMLSWRAVALDVNTESVIQMGNKLAASLYLKR